MREETADDVPVLVITGPVGVGKTTVASAISDVLRRAGVPHAMVDLDQLREVFPAPADDPFHSRLGLRNLAAVWDNARLVGARRLVLADVVESAAAIRGYEAAIPGGLITIVRLTAPLKTIQQRLAGRDSGASLDWHRRRAAELAALMDRDPVEHLLVDTEGRTVDAVAHDILVRSRWLE